MGNRHGGQQTFLVAILTAAMGCGGQSGLSPVEITQSEEGYVFTQGADSVLVYRHRAGEGPHGRAHYVHPLYSLSGEVLTEDSPADHLHQHGIYWAWHQVYVGNERIGDGWIQEDIAWDVRQVDILEGDSAIRSLVTWVSPNSEPIVEETATIRVHPLTDGFRLVDFEIELTALLDSVSLGGSEDEKGYGGFSARVRLPEDVAFTGPRGAIEPIETDVEAGPWVDISLGASGIAILQHPSNPGYPQPWILRRAGSMQNPSWPGREPVLLPKGAPLVLRYRIVVHEGGGVSPDELHERYAAWN